MMNKEKFCAPQAFIIDLSRKHKDKLKDKLPVYPGVYIIKYFRKFGRFKGKSDILYIGRAERSLRERIQHYFTPGKKDKSDVTNQRIHSAIKKSKHIRITWKISSNATGLEQRLLKKYYNSHGEFPPLNRNIPKTVHK